MQVPAKTPRPLELLVIEEFGVVFDDSAAQQSVIRGLVGRLRVVQTFPQKHNAASPGH